MREVWLTETMRLMAVPLERIAPCRECRRLTSEVANGTQGGGETGSTVNGQIVSHFTRSTGRCVDCTVKRMYGHPAGDARWNPVVEGLPEVPS